MLYGKITGTYRLVVADGDDGDAYPDALAAQGTVTFTPSVPYILNAVDKVTFAPQTITCILGPNGEILDQEGRTGVNLVATDDPDNNPSDWTYSVEVRLVGVQFSQRFNISVPAGKTSDLSELMPVASSPGNAIIRGEPGPAGLPGVNAIPAAEAVAIYVQQDSPVRDALLGNFAPISPTGDYVPTGRSLVAVDEDGTPFLGTSHSDYALSSPVTVDIDGVPVLLDPEAGGLPLLAEVTLSAASPSSGPLTHLNQWIVDGPVQVELPLNVTPGSQFTIHVKSGFQNLSWPNGTVVYGETDEDEVWVTLIRGDAGWNVLIPSAGLAPGWEFTPANYADGTITQSLQFSYGTSPDYDPEKSYGGYFGVGYLAGTSLNLQESFAERSLSLLLTPGTIQGSTAPRSGSGVGGTNRTYVISGLGLDFHTYEMDANGTPDIASGSFAALKPPHMDFSEYGAGTTGGDGVTIQTSRSVPDEAGLAGWITTAAMYESVFVVSLNKPVWKSGETTVTDAMGTEIIYPEG